MTGHDANIRLVQGVYNDYVQGKFDAVIAAFTPDAEWHSGGTREHFPAFGVFKGHSGMKSFIDTVVSLVEFQEFTPKEFYADKDKVIAFGHYTFTLKKSQQKVTSDWAHIFTIKDGKVTKFREFLDTAALVAAHRAL